MGISGLLPALKSITETKALEEYRGKTLAIDGYCWLHRAIYSCSQEICLGQETDKYVTYFLERVDMLRHNGIIPYVVFDGGPLPMKKGTEVDRRAARQKNRELGIQCFKQKNYAEARKYFSRAADVSPYMAHRVIQHLKARDVRYVVAPYEADAQLAYLTKNGLADGVITEDSDCLPFGCGTVLFKLDKDGVGLAQEIRESNLKHNKGLLFHMFTPEMFLEMCIFSGCDYLPSLPGFGLKKAYGALKQHGSFTKVIRALRLEGKVRIPPTYESDFERAVLTFKHQRVYDPVTQQLVHLTPLPASSSSVGDSADAAAMDFLGPMLANDVATAIAHGDVDPITMEHFPARTTPVPPPAVRKPPTARAPTATGLVRPSFFQTNRQGAAPPTHANALLHGRRLPHSFGRTPAPPAPSIAAMLQAQQARASAPSPPSCSLETTPLVVSRFFAAQTTSALSSSAAPEAAESSSSDGLALTPPSSSFESQEPLDVDVAQSISLSPLEGKTHTVVVVVENKENCTPPRSATSPAAAAAASAMPAPVVKENAFARMMRAGSMLQQQSLKRKAAGAMSHRHGKQHAGLYGHQRHQRPAAAPRMQQYVHVETERSSRPSPSRSLSRSLSAEPEPEWSAPAAAAAADTDDASAGRQPSTIVARGSCLGAVQEPSPSRREAVGGADAPRGAPMSATPSVLASLDRFRFKP